MNAKINLRNFVDLVTDCSRRDLTINSIAIDVKTNEYINPYGGIDDIKNKVFRPVSDHFMEDPVRVLRVARFYARFGSEWTLSTDLKKMVRKMVKDGKLSALQPDRVWKELSRAMMEPYPRLFFDALLELDALHVVFPEIYKMLTALKSRLYHPEGNAYEHTMLVLTQAAQNYDCLTTRMAALLHDIGKTLTPFNKLPAHYGHDVNGVALVAEFCDKYHVPVDIKQVSMYTCRYHMNMHWLPELNAKTIVKMFDERKQNDDKIEYLYRVGVCDERGRLGSEQNDVSNLSLLKDMFAAYKTVKFSTVFPNGETNPNKIKDGLFKARVSVVNTAKKG